MKLLRNLEDTAAFRGGVVSIGNFDGVHRGHAALVVRLRELADRRGTQAVIFTFDPHPAEILRPHDLPMPLTTLEERATLLHAHGAEVIVAYPTDARLLRLTPTEFFAEVVVEALGAVALVEGPNFRFGRDRTGDVHALQRLAQAHSMELVLVPPCAYRGQIVSSSWIRTQLLAGQVEQAAGGLGRVYSLTGRVVKGAGRGSKLGFPTANLEEIRTLTPGDGVYAARARCEERTWPAAVNIGPNPTFGESVRKVEAHLVGFAGELEQSRLRIEFIHRLRDTRAFAGAEQLVSQLHQDVLEAKQWFHEQPGAGSEPGVRDAGADHPASPCP